MARAAAHEVDMRTPLISFSAALLLFTGACEPDSSDGVDASTGADTTAGSAGTTEADQPTTGEVPTTGASAADDAGSATAAEAGDDTSAGDDGGATAGESDGGDTAGTTGEPPGEPDPEIVASCGDYCGRWTECGLQPDEADCIAGCVDSIGAVASACKAAHQDELACAAALTCEQLLDSLGDGGPCAPQHAAVIDACEGGGGGECLESSGQSSEGCDFSRICDGQPVLTMQCDDSSCTCLSGETKVGECAADGVCGEPDGLAAKAAACCAF